jgi:hypothetical protein
MINQLKQIKIQIQMIHIIIQVTLLIIIQIQF